MKIDKESFLKIFETSFWTKLKESIVPYSTNPDKAEFLNNLYNEIVSFTYNPSNPRDYIVINKHNGISRYVPTFTRKDYCVYYFCIKLLENEIAVNRVENTYGGWSLGNQIRLKEEQEIIELEYIPFNTLNPLSWIQEWQSFQAIARKHRDLGAWSCFINTDISNFYDCINLTILERKIRHVIPKQKQEIVTLLFHLLRNWNKKLEGYNHKTVGIPQDEIGDCSRILANFYLQDYDSKMKEVSDKLECKYIRFADDQIFYAKTLDNAKEMLFEASRELLRVNLNLNSGKVKEFRSVIEFNEYWAFEIFDLLEDSKNSDSINKAVDIFLYNTNKQIKFRDVSVLKRLLRTDFSLIKPEFRHQLIARFFNPDFLAMLNLWSFRKIREKVNNDKEFFGELDNLIDKVPFNSFHYNLRAFYKKERADYDFAKLDERINKIRI